MSWYENDDFWRTFASPMFDDKWERAPSEVDQILELVDVEPPGTILDLCCGPGRHTLELARRGFEVVGVDRNSEFIEDGRSRAREEELDVEFVVSDMREFLRPDTFDAAINMFTAFGYFEDPDDDRRVVRQVFESLRPGGTFLIEGVGKEILARKFRPSALRRLDDDTRLLEERRVTKDWSWLSNTWTMITNDGEVKDFALEHRIYSAVEMKRLFTDVGFEEARAFGSLAGTPYDQEAERLVVVGQKGE